MVALEQLHCLIIRETQISVTFCTQTISVLGAHPKFTVVTALKHNTVLLDW